MLQALFENSFDCIKVLDLDGRLVSINRRGCVLLEIDNPQEFIGRSWIDIAKNSSPSTTTSKALPPWCMPPCFRLCTSSGNPSMPNGS